GRSHVTATCLRSPPSPTRAAPPRSKRGTAKSATPLAESLLTARSAGSGHLGQPVAQMTPLRAAGAGQAMPRRTHCVRANHVDHPTFVTFLSIRQRYIAMG